MVSEIINVTDIKWFTKNKPLDRPSLGSLSKFPFALPRKFIELLKISDGGNVDYEFKYYDTEFKDSIGSGIGLILGVASENTKIPNEHYDYMSTSGWEQKEFFISYNNITDQYNNPPEFFPKGIVAFASTGNGDYICFDYRDDSKTDNPPIVYWNHEADEGKDISFIAKDFEEFLSILKEPEE